MNDLLSQMIEEMEQDPFGYIAIAKLNAFCESMGMGAKDHCAHGKEPMQTTNEVDVESPTAAWYAPAGIHADIDWSLCAIEKVQHPEMPSTLATTLGY